MTVAPWNHHGDDGPEVNTTGHFWKGRSSILTSDFLVDIYKSGQEPTAQSSPVLEEKLLLLLL